MKIIFALVIAGILFLGYKQITKKGVKGSGGATGGNGDTDNGDDNDSPVDVPKRVGNN